MGTQNLINERYGDVTPTMHLSPANSSAVIDLRRLRP